MPPDYRVKVARSGLCQLVQQVTGRDEVCGRKTLAEAAVDGGKEIAYLRAAVLVAPKPR